ncbi:MAG: hypothetical protein HN929_08960 [Chloroflexi bacterium]|jgi:hypothetical protein|nr:hypothetical protein [Chloroflexota bacterium]MBT7081579.1 hypothetical protein [Chloroflexota bacterium]MBT7288967.1 hypothetical protein [Chloroflexota bacterium]
MIVTVTTTTIVTGMTYSLVSALSLLVALSLIIILIIVEIAKASKNRYWLRVVTDMNIIVVPFFILFSVMVVDKFVTVSLY